MTCPKKGSPLRIDTEHSGMLHGQYYTFAHQRKPAPWRRQRPTVGFSSTSMVRIALGLDGRKSRFGLDRFYNAWQSMTEAEVRELLQSGTLILTGVLAPHRFKAE